MNEHHMWRGATENGKFDKKSPRASTDCAFKNEKLLKILNIHCQANGIAPSGAVCRALSWKLLKWLNLSHNNKRRGEHLLELEKRRSGRRKCNKSSRKSQPESFCRAFLIAPNLSVSACLTLTSSLIQKPLECCTFFTN